MWIQSYHSVLPNPTRFTHRCHKLVDHLIEKHESVMKESFVRRLDRCVNVDRKLSIHCDLMVVLREFLNQNVHVYVW